MVQEYHYKGFYVIARFVLFKEWYLAQKKPEWNLREKSNGRPYETREGQTWLDASDKELSQYLIEISEELASLGFDEIQYDYVRFPEAGKGGVI